ncbi:hypothetical protein ACVWXL_005886 [Bradyrhizobium sp. GM22.5]
MRLPRTVTVTNVNVAPVAVRERDRNYGWAEIQALRAFTRMN